MVIVRMNGSDKGRRIMLPEFNPIGQLTTQEAQQEIAKWQDELTQYGVAYYEKDAPLVEDYIYDAIYARLVDLESKFPQFVTPDSPTQKCWWC